LKVEILYFEGCPGHQRAMPLVSTLAAEVGATVELRRVETPEAAETERFLGSPTVRVNGRDVEPGAEDRSDYGLTCRVYHSKESGQSTIPTESWIRDALKG
jgi:hypothetical protein